MSAHAKAQLARFVRTFALALLTAYVAAGDRLDWRSLIALIPPAAEVALRELMPVAPVPAVSVEPAPPESP